MDSVSAYADARHVSLSRPRWRSFLVLFYLLASCTALFGDGGLLVLHQASGPFTVSVFSSPLPLHAGIADLSVLLQAVDDDSIVMDADIHLRLSKKGEANGEANGDASIAAQVTHSQATNKVLYATRVQIPSPGNWSVTVKCTRGGREAEVTGNVTVLPEEPAAVSYWPYFAVIPAAIGLFALNQRLKATRRLKYRR